MKTIMTIKLSTILQIHCYSGNQRHQYLTSSLCPLLVEEFNEFFYTKIAKIMDKLRLNALTHNPNKFIEDEYQTEMKIGILTPVSYMDVINMVKSVPPKSYKLDPMPTKILKITLMSLPME